MYSAILLVIYLFLSPVLAVSTRSTFTTTTSTAGVVGRTYVSISETYIGYGVVPSALRRFATEQACAQYAQDSGAIGYTYGSGGGAFTGSCPNDATRGCNCALFPRNTYPSTCSGYKDNGVWSTGWIDKCTNPPGYSMAADSTCVFGASFPPTRAQYNAVCVNNKPNPSAAVQPYKRSGIVDFDSKSDDLILPIGLKYSPALCPGLGFKACPIKNGFECIQIDTHIESCGGCFEALGEGEDCTALPGVDSVSCRAGRCIVGSCAKHFKLEDGRCNGVRK